MTVTNAKMAFGILGQEMVAIVATVMQLEAITLPATSLRDSVTVNRALPEQNVTNARLINTGSRWMVASNAIVTRSDLRDDNVTNMVNVRAMIMLRGYVAIGAKKIRMIERRDVSTVLTAIIWYRTPSMNIVRN